MTFFDLQINGYAGIDFNSLSLKPEELHYACESLKEDGVDKVLLTIITDSVNRMCSKLKNITRFLESDTFCQSLIAGFHIEGPFLNEEKGYIGAHPKKHAIVANNEDMMRIIESSGGLTKLVTLAPERDPNNNVTKLLQNIGVKIAAGHCNPSMDQLKSSIDSGLDIFTHIGNGCPILLNRHDNIIQRVLSLSDKIWITFIADGIHIPFSTLKNYLQIIPISRAIAVTDAIAGAKYGSGEFTLGQKKIKVDIDGSTIDSKNNNFAGSTLTFPLIKSNLKEHLNLKDNTIDLITNHNPRKAVPID